MGLLVAVVGSHMLVELSQQPLGRRQLPAREMVEQGRRQQPQPGDEDAVFVHHLQGLADDGLGTFASGHHPVPGDRHQVGQQTGERSHPSASNASRAGWGCQV